MNLSDLKKRLVDLRRSDYDKERSSPKDGRYFWNKKVYLKFDDYKDDNVRPNFKYRWVAYDDKNDFAQFNHWRMNFEATLLITKTRLLKSIPSRLCRTSKGITGIWI